MGYTATYIFGHVARRSSPLLWQRRYGFRHFKLLAVASELKVIPSEVAVDNAQFSGHVERMDIIHANC